MFKSLILDPTRHPRHAWMIAVLMLVMATILMGIIFTFGFFFKAIAAEFELSRAVTSAIVSTNIIIGGLTAVAIPASGLPRLRLGNLARQPSFWYFLVAWATNGYSMFFVFSHLVPYITDQGFSGTQAVGVVSVMGFAALVGRLPAGVLADRIGRRRLGIISAVLLSLAMLLLAWIAESWAFYVFAVHVSGRSRIALINKWRLLTV